MEWLSGLEPLRKWSGSRSGVLFDEIKENRNSKDSTHFSAIVSVVAWSHEVELQ